MTNLHLESDGKLSDGQVGRGNRYRELQNKYFEWKRIKKHKKSEQEMRSVGKEDFRIRER